MVDKNSPFFQKSNQQKSARQRIFCISLRFLKPVNLEFPLFVVNICLMIMTVDVVKDCLV